MLLKTYFYSYSTFEFHKQVNIFEPGFCNTRGLVVGALAVTLSGWGSCEARCWAAWLQEWTTGFEVDFPWRDEVSMNVVVRLPKNYTMTPELELAHSFDLEKLGLILVISRLGYDIQTVNIIIIN